VQGALQSCTIPAPLTLPRTEAACRRQRVEPPREFKSSASHGKAPQTSAHLSFAALLGSRRVALTSAPLTEK
jgi:hypothetical protein